MTSGVPSIDVAKTADTELFWSELSQGRFTLPWCESCNTFVWYPKALCTRCLNEVPQSRTLSGDGTVYSFSITHRAPPPLNEVAPYVLAYVSLDGGPTVLSNVVGNAARDVAIGDRVRMVNLQGFAPAIRFELLR